jgi:competence protein ComEC
MFLGSARRSWQRCGRVSVSDAFSVAHEPAGLDRADLRFLCVALGAVVGARLHLAIPVLLGGVVLAVGLRRSSTLVVVVGIALFVSSLSARSLAGLRPPPTGIFTGPITLLTDPQEVPGGIRCDVRVGRSHLLATVHGRVAWQLARLDAGAQLTVVGRVSPLGITGDWAVARHLRGRLSVKEVLTTNRGAWPWRLAANARNVLLRGVAHLDPTTRALYGGFVLGDDRGQPAEVTADFRGAGLTHLLVVSGQNVAFLLVAARPLLERLRLPGRTAVTLMLLALFGTITRWEPSVLRATAMACVTVLGSGVGRPVGPLRRLSLGCTALLIIDPLLAWSVGFALSAGACLGLAVLTKPIARALAGPRWLVQPLATTLAATAGTAPLLLGVFGDLPMVAPAANLLALPAAEPAMVWGLAAGVPAGMVGGWLARIAHLPTWLLIGWVRVVARLAGWLPLGGASFGLLVAVGCCLAIVTKRPWLRRRWCTAFVVAIALHTALGMLRPPQLRDVLVARNARFTRVAGTTRLDLGAADAGRTLDGLRRIGIRHIDEVVVVRATRGALTRVAVIRTRISIDRVRETGAHPRKGTA